jgi:PKD repeat protein
MRKIQLIILSIFIIRPGFSQCPTAINFSLNESVCNSSEIIFTNNSAETEAYNWDFYPKDFAAGLQTPINKWANSDTINNPRGVTFAFDSISGQMYSILIDFNADRLITAQLDANYSAPIAMYDLGNPGGQMSNSFSSMRFNGNVGFLASGGSPGEIAKYFFTSGFNQAPDSVKAYTSTALNEYEYPGNLKLVQEGDDNLILVCNRNSTKFLSVLSMGNSLNNTPILINKINDLNLIDNSNAAVDLDVLKICNEWIAYLLLDDGTVTILNFGNSFTNVPVKSTFSQINIGGTATNIKAIHEDGKVHLFCLGTNNTFETYQIDSSGLLFEQALYSVSNIFGDGGNDSRSFDIIKLKSTYKILGCNRSGSATRRGIYLGEFENGNADSSAVSNNAIPLSAPYTLPGVYYVSLTGVDTAGNVSSKLDSVTLLDAIQVNFSSQGSCLDYPRNFTDLSSSQTLSTTGWNWQFGDGDSSLLQNPTHQYTIPGTYSVSLRIEANNGCKTTLHDDIFISDLRPEQPAFGFSPDIICENTFISFYDSTQVIQDSVIAYFWDFGDGGTSVLQNPNHQYSVSGNYTVSLLLKGKYDCDTTVSKIINVQAGPAPNFSGLDFCEGSSTSFTDISTTISPAQIIAWKWFFGDGDSSLLQNPNHLYLNAGNYLVNIQIETDSGCISSYSSPIVIESLPIPDFSYEVPCAQTEISFVNETIGNITNALWTNSNNTNDSSLNANFTFDNIGFEEVNLTITNSSGCIDSITKTIEIFPAFTPEFSFSNTCMGDTVQFTDNTASFSIVSRFWNFGFLNQGSTVKNPSFYYPNPGSYNVNLRLVNAIGCENDTTQTIEIKNLPLANAIVENNCLDSEALFYDNSTTNNATLIGQLWKIEHEFFSSDSVKQLFNTSGAYIANYQIEDSFGCRDDTIFTFEINELPQVDFDFTPNYGTAPIDVNFTNLSQGATGFLWNFGDMGSLSNEENPSYTYLQNGIYDITLVAENIFGCIDSLIKEIPIIPTELDIELSDLTIQKITLADGSIAYMPSVLVKNIGSRALTNMDLSASIDGETKVAETWLGTLTIGQAFIYDFNSFFVINNIDLVEYVCVEAKNVNDNTELNFTNNKVCLIQNGLIQSSKLYPNPSQEIAYMDVITNKQGDVQLGVYDVLGRNILESKNVPIQDGYNQIAIDCSSLQAGEYFVRMVFQDEVYSQILIISNK